MNKGSDGPQAALHARVSSDRQAQSHTIASQVDAIKRRIAEDGLVLTEALCFLDDGYSGATLIRPAMDRLRNMAWAGAIDRLYVHSPDRLARNCAYQILVVEELRNCGVELVFLNREIGRSPEDDLLLQMQGMFAEYERTKIMERARRGKLHAAQQGRVNVLSGAPYGYRYLSAGSCGGQAQYQILLEEARVVREAFAWVAQERCSIAEVTRRLKKQGIPTRTGKAVWNRSTVLAMLNNPAYKGMAGFGKTRACPLRPRLRPRRGCCEQPRHCRSEHDTERDQWIDIPVPAIVDGDLFDAVREQLDENRRRSRLHARGARYLLQGLLVCQRCGYALCANVGPGKGGSHAYYVCTNRRSRLNEVEPCDNRAVRGEALEKAVWEDACALLSDPGRIEKEYQRRLTPRHRGIGWDSPQQVQRQIAKVKRAIARLVDAYEDGLLDRPEFEPRLQRAKECLGALQKQAQSQADEGNSSPICNARGWQRRELAG